MAVITSTTSGNFGTGATWVGGVVPIEGDSVVIARTSTGLETFSTDAAGYAVGATSITLTGTVLAGSYVIGEAVQFGSTDPNYYTITNWNSVTKVLTVSALIIAIPASATLVRCRGHVVTVNGTYIAGDDTTTAFTVNGTLCASRTVNSSLTIKGDLKTAATVSAKICYGSDAQNDRIPSSVTATLILNYSAAMSNYKYGMLIANASSANFCGAVRNINATSTSSIAVGGTSVNVDDATGWAVGDTIVLPSTNGTSTTHEKKTITSLTLISGTAYTAGFSATSFAHASGCSVGNLSSNVVIKSYNTTNPAYVCFNNATTASNGTREIRYISLQYIGSDTVSPQTKCFVSSNGGYYSSPFVYIGDFSVYNGHNTVGLFLYSWQTQSAGFNNVAFYGDNGAAGSFWYFAQGTSVNISSSVFYHASGQFLASGYSQGGQGCILTSCKFWSIPSGGMFSLASGAQIIFNSCSFHTGYPLYFLSGKTLFNNCKFADSSQVGSPTMPYLVNGAVTQAQVVEATFTDCLFGTPTAGTYINQSLINSTSSMYIVNKNANITAQEFYGYAGLMVRDNATFNRSSSSEKFAPQTANRAFTRTFTVPAPNNTARRVIGYLRYDTNYGVTTPPSVTLSGLGITPQTYTAGGTANTWYKFDLSATQTSGADGNLTLTTSGQSTATTGFFWVDGIPDTPFMSINRHYGFLFDNLIYRTVDPIIQQTTEATVGAYTGIAIAGTTITLTVNRTVRELYDYCKYYLCQTANLTVADFFTSTDGINFTCTYDLTVNGCTLSGSGNINMPTRTLSVIGGGSTVPIITYNAGTRVNIVLTGIVTNSRAQLYDVTATTELYNDVVAGTSVTVPYVWTTDRSIRYRVMYVSGATAYRWVEATGTVTNTGMNITIAQELDPIYNLMAIDGSTVTECAIVGTTLVISVDDPNNITSAQRLLAFEIYWLSTVGGIRDQSLYIEYADSTHLIFEGGLKIKNLDLVNPLSITGASIVPTSGNPTDVIDTSGGSININTDRVVSYNDPTRYLTTVKFLGLKD